MAEAAAEAGSTAAFKAKVMKEGPEGVARAARLAARAAVIAMGGTEAQAATAAQAVVSGT
jgi:hypothetical protein